MCPAWSVTYVTRCTPSFLHHESHQDGVKTKAMKRIIDIAAASLGLATMAVPALLVAVAVRATSRGPAIHWSRRIGRNGREFLMPKFRSMRVGTPQLASDRMGNAAANLTPIGGLLRTTSLDEIPQLWSILRGDMSLVGPRPALFNQYELIRRRRELGIDTLRPGLTGWAQVNGRDHASEEQKVRLDAEYLHRASLAFDARIIVLTVWRVVRRDGVSH
jgi:O-antigen biosynthesis protein WbqP